MMRDLNKDSRPIERIIQGGSENLSNAELLSILLNSGGKGISALELANILLNKYENIENILSQNAEELMENKFISYTKAARLKAALQISKALFIKKDEKSITYVKTPEDVFNLIKSKIQDYTQEHLYLICLNIKNVLVSCELVFKGNISQTLMTSRELIQKALARNALCLIICHNHPSEELTPSPEDLMATEKLAKACNSVGIKLLDHVVITKTEYISFKAAGFFSISN